MNSATEPRTATVTETSAPPLEMPDLTTVETDYDRFKARRAKLVDALRSGKHNQTIGSLRDDDGVCFVGLAADTIG